MRTSGAHLYICDRVGNQLADALLLPDGRNLFMGGIAFGDSYLLDMVTGLSTYSYGTVVERCPAPTVDRWPLRLVYRGDPRDSSNYNGMVRRRITCSADADGLAIMDALPLQAGK